MAERSEGAASAAELSVVLARGAGADGSNWARVVSPLVAAGYGVLAAHAYARAAVAAVQRPIAAACVSTRVGTPSWRNLPSWFLIAEQDYLISPETQRLTAQRMRARVRSQQVDHTPMVTAPAAVIDIIRAAIAAVGSR